MPLHVRIYVLLIAMGFGWSAHVPFVAQRGGMRRSSWCSVLSILAGNAGYAATAVSYRAYVFDRIVDIVEGPWACWWNGLAFGWWF